MTRTTVVLVLILLGVVASAPKADDDNVASARYEPGARIHDVYLKNTDHELHVYKIFGKKPGKTLLIIGGIHGNEPGSYLAASHYVDLSLKRGNLIIVPRANLNSILQNARGQSGDYNRKFASDLDTDNYDDKIISVLKDLMRESDGVLNLHDGSGFYREKWIDDMNNPFRFGQSIIADSDTFTIPDSEITIDLGTMARRVVEQVNQDISNEKYKFRFANHDSISENTDYPDMRKTATFYALTQHHIPAFGIETSKSLPSNDLKVEHQILVINAFMTEFGIVPEIPAKQVEKARFDYLVLDVNEDRRYVVKNGESLSVSKGSIVRVDHIVGNYEDTMFADIHSYGGKNDNGLEVAVQHPLKISVRKDSELCGSVRIIPETGTMAESHKPSTHGDIFVLEINGERRHIYPNETVDLFFGDKLKIVDYISASGDPVDVVNLKGFVGQQNDNTGEDRGYIVDTARDLMSSWSLGGQGNSYAIVARQGGYTVDTMKIALHKLTVSHIVYAIGDQEPRVAGNGQTVELQGSGEISLLSLVTEGEQLLRHFTCLVNGKPVEGDFRFALQKGSNEIVLQRGEQQVFSLKVDVIESQQPSLSNQ